MSRRIAACLGMCLLLATTCGPRDEGDGGGDADDPAGGAEVLAADPASSDPTSGRPDAAEDRAEASVTVVTPHTTTACGHGQPCPCTPLGGLCLKGFECCSGLCLSYTCMPYCRPEGSPCRADGDCCLSACIAGFCGMHPCIGAFCGMSGCGVDGSPCGVNDQCCSGSCLGSRCLAAG